MIKYYETKYIDLYTELEDSNQNLGDSQFKLKKKTMFLPRIKSKNYYENSIKQRSIIYKLINSV